MAQVSLVWVDILVRHCGHFGALTHATMDDRVGVLDLVHSSTFYCTFYGEHFGVTLISFE